MQRWTALVFAALTAAFCVPVILANTAHHSPASAADAGADAAAEVKGTTLDGGADRPDAEADAEAPEEGASATSDAGATLLDGQPAPGLATDAPKSVVIGVILVQYKGAQGAPPTARSREAALDLAKDLAAEAKTNFKATVAKGDKGSSENVGRMPRGMLEPAPEFVIFSLPKDGVSDPVDTPRGFWIAHRVD